MSSVLIWLVGWLAVNVWVVWRLDRVKGEGWNRPMR